MRWPCKANLSTRSRGSLKCRNILIGGDKNNLPQKITVAHESVKKQIGDQKRIAGFALKSRLPSVYSNREFVDAGGLMFYGADLADSHRRVAYYVDKS